MKKWFYLIAILAFSGCSDNDPVPEVPKQRAQIKVHAFYVEKFGNDRQPDVGSRVFIYYDIYNLIDYSYEEGGILTYNKDGSRIVPDQESVIDGRGDAVIFPKYTDRMIALIIPSNYYQGRLGTFGITDRDFSRATDSTIIYTVTNYP